MGYTAHEKLATGSAPSSPLSALGCSELLGIASAAWRVAPWRCVLAAGRWPLAAGRQGCFRRKLQKAAAAARKQKAEGAAAMCHPMESI
jgi:hypothetical protein